MGKRNTHIHALDQAEIFHGDENLAEHHPSVKWETDGKMKVNNKSGLEKMKFSQTLQVINGYNLSTASPDLQSHQNVTSFNLKSF